MRRYVVTLSSFLSLAGVIAQPIIGVKAGGERTLVSVRQGDAVLTVVPDPEVEQGWGYHGGVFAEFALDEEWFIRPELLYTYTEHAVAVVFDSTLFGITARVDADVDVRRTTFELPLLAGYRPSEALSIVLGPSLCYLSKAESFTDGRATVGGFFQGLTFPFNASNNSLTGLHQLRWSLVAGLNYRTTGGFEVGFRFLQGLGYLESDTRDIKSRRSGLQLALGYAFVR